MRNSCGALICVSGISPRMGIRRVYVPFGRLLSVHRMDCDCVHVDVDQRRQIYSDSQALTLRYSPNENTMSMLDGVYLDLVGYDVYTTLAR